MDDIQISGQTFIAYRGTELRRNDIVNALNEICPKASIVNYKIDEEKHLVFAKVISRDMVLMIPF